MDLYEYVKGSWILIKKNIDIEDFKNLDVNKNYRLKQNDVFILSLYKFI
jgi:hypothetical protein